MFQTNLKMSFGNSGILSVDSSIVRIFTKNIDVILVDPNNAVKFSICAALLGRSATPYARKKYQKCLVHV